MTETIEVVAPERITVKEFFENVPPGRSSYLKNISNYIRSRTILRAPPIELHCVSDTCQGVRFFEATDSCYLDDNKANKFLTFRCKNCNKTTKTYAFWVLSEDGETGEMFKFGEQPPFGSPTPARVMTLIGSERDYYLKGRRAENQNLGIAAFAYYRRVVENQKTRIIDEIIRVAQKVGASEDVLKDLAAARAETQFTKAVEAIKHGIPQSLLVGGHNPLALLHSALSEGLHAQTDQECLELATSIRVVLTELVERMSTVLKEGEELNTAVARLVRAKAERKKTE